MAFIFVTSGSTVPDPGNWPGSGALEVIAAGGAARDALTSNQRSVGGSAGAYSKTNSLTFTVGAGGITVSIGAAGTTNGADGADAWASTTGSAPTLTTQGVLAKHGLGGIVANTGLSGGAAASGVGNVTHSGGGTVTCGLSGSGGGGAGAAGALGNGGNGGGNSVSGGGGNGGGGVGDGASGTNGSAGANATNANGVAGGNNAAGTGAGAAGGAGQGGAGGVNTGGGGGGNGDSAGATLAGGAGSMYPTWDSIHGPGSGMGGGTKTSGTVATGAGYGQGGAGQGGNGGSETSFQQGGPGLLVVTYTPSGGIAFDASSNSGDQSSVSTFTFSRTVTLANPFLALDVGLLSTPNATVTAIDDFGGGNVNIPIIGSQVATGIGLIVQLGLANPVTGTKTIQVNLSASLTSGAVATIYGGVDQIEPTEAFNSAQGVNVGAANASVTITPIVDKTWIHAATSTNDPAATNNQTSRGTVTDAVFGRVLAEDNNAAVTPAAATTMTAAIAAAKAWAIAGYAIRPTGSIDRGLFRIPPMNGLGSGGSFFSNPLA